MSEERRWPTGWPRRWAPSWGTTAPRSGCAAGTARSPAPRAPGARRALAARCAGCCGRPGELGLGRAYVAGEIDIEDDVFAAFAALSSPAGWPGTRPAGASGGGTGSLLGTALALGAIGPTARRRRRRPARRRPAAQPAPRPAGDHPPLRRRQRLLPVVLGPSMVYSCAVWAAPSSGLEDAQRAKLDLVCRKLELRPGGGCSTSAAAGAAWPSTPPSATA